MGGKTTSALSLSKLSDVKAQSYTRLKNGPLVDELLECMTTILAKQGVGRAGFAALGAGLPGRSRGQGTWLAFG